jgi:hypothetical protein
VFSPGVYCQAAILNVDDLLKFCAIAVTDVAQILGVNCPIFFANMQTAGDLSALDINVVAETAIIPCAVFYSHSTIYC